MSLKLVNDRARSGMHNIPVKAETHYMRSQCQEFEERRM